MLIVRTRDKLALMAAAIVGLMFYFDDRYLLDSNCSATSGYAQISRDVKGRRFWLQQLERVEEEIRLQLDEISSLKHIEQVSVEARGEAQQLRARLYKDLPELRPSPAQAYAQQLRDTADAVELHANLSLRAAEANQRAQTGAMCRAIIQKNLGQH